MSAEHLQLFEALPAPVESALRASIQRFGVLVPVVKDQHGKLIDGRHRSRIADQIGVKYRVDVIQVRDDDEAADIQRTLNTDRRHLSEEQRREIVAALAEQTRMIHGEEVAEHSPNAIADALGVSLKTVQDDIAELTTASKLNRPDKAVGKDGKVRPTRRPTVVTAKNEREAERAQQALAVVGDDMPATAVMDVKRLERIAREAEAERKRAEPIEERTNIGDVDIRLGDFRETLSDIEPGSVDAIITDPPYPQEFWDPYSPRNVFEALGAVARVLLKPNGVLAIMIGTKLEMLDQVDYQIGQNMRRRHRAIYLTPGPRWRDNVERVATGYKPIMIYAHPESVSSELAWINDDVFTSSGDDKEHHHWGQSESGIASLVERLTRPGQLVIDPFLGGGTMALVCRDLGRRFIGCDVDAASISTARERLA